jgi:hypothetical protein
MSYAEIQMMLMAVQVFLGGALFGWGLRDLEAHRMNTRERNARNGGGE